MKQLVCCVVVALTAVVALAEVKWTYSGTVLTEILPSGSSDTAWTFNLTAEGALTLKTAGSNPEVDLRRESLPDAAPTVVSLGSSIFRSNTTIRKVFFSDGLTTVGAEAFRQCSNLKELILPDSVSSVGNKVCYYCTSLTNVVVPATLTQIGQESYISCSALADFTMPPSVTSIGDSAFYGCSSLKDFDWPSGLKSIGSYAFKKCSKLTRVELSASLTTIGSEAFRECSSLESVTPFLPASVTSLGAGAFKIDSKLAGDFAYGFAVDGDGAPVSVTLGTDTLQSDSKITSVRLGPGVKSIANNFFQSCSSVGYLELGSNVTDVATLNTCLRDNKVLTNVVFQTTSTLTFPNQTFRGCTNLKEISLNGWFEYSPTDATNPFYGWSALQCRLIVPGDNADWSVFCADTTKLTPWASSAQADKDAYFTRYGQGAKEPVGISVAVANGLPKTYIVKTEAKISGFPLTVSTSDERFVTMTCSPELPQSGIYPAETEVTVKVNVADGATFHGWSGSVPVGYEKATELTITMDEAKSLYACVTSDTFFYENGYLVDGEFKISATRTISGSVTNFALNSVAVIPSALVDLYDFTKPIKDGGAIISFGADLLRNNTKVRHVKLPETLMSIGSAAFRDCTNLETVTPLLPQTVTSIGGSAFKNDGKLEGDFAYGFAVDATGGTVKVTMETDVLLGAEKIASVRFGPGVTSIPNNYFAYCSSVGYLELGSSLTNVYSLSTCLRDNKALTNVVFLTTETISFPNQTFRGCTNLREISFNGWFTYTATDATNPFYGWSDLQCRFVVPHDHPDWQALFADGDAFVLWSACDEIAKTTYYEKYGVDARRPRGITKAVENGLRRTYVVTRPGLPGMILIVR